MYGRLPSEEAAPRPDPRLGRAADRPGRRVRLLRIAGDQGAARRRASPRSSSIRTSRRSRPAASWRTASTSSPVTARVRRAHHRQGRRRRDPALVRRTDRAQLRPRARTTRRAREVRRPRARARPIDAIRDTEDRHLFVERLDEIGVKTARSRACDTIAEARDAAREIGLPVMLRLRLRARRQGQRHRRDGGRARAALRRAFAGGTRRCSSRSACGDGRRSSTRSCATRATTASPSATWRTSIRWGSTPASRSSSRRRRR